MSTNRHTVLQIGAGLNRIAPSSAEAMWFKSGHGSLTGFTTAVVCLSFG